MKKVTRLVLTLGLMCGGVGCDFMDDSESSDEVVVQPDETTTSADESRGIAKQ